MQTLLLSLIFAAPAVSPAAGPKLSCGKRLSLMLAGLKDTNNHQSVTAESVVLTSGGAFAEYTHPCPRDGSFCTPSKKGSASPFYVSGGLSSATSIGGTSYVAAPPDGAAKKATFFIFKKGRKARLRWILDGKQYESKVDSCQGNYWTAATHGSAFAVHLGPVTKRPAPPK